MKKFPFLIVGIITLFLGILFAQSATITALSIVEKMKAASHEFTLITELNPGQTGLKSGPLSGKKTGEMITAEEYNRILELFAALSKGGKCPDEEYLQGFNTDGTLACKKFPVSLNLNGPRGIAVDTNGNVFVCNTGDHTIVKVTPNGIASSFVGSPGVAGAKDGIGDQANFNTPSGIARAADGTLYVADTLNHAIRKITADGNVTTLVGKLGTAGAADGTGETARFNEPYALIVDGADTLYVADFKNYAVRKVVISTGTVSTVVGILGSRATYSIPGDKQSNFGYTHGSYGGRLFGPISLTKMPDGRILIIDPSAPTVNYGLFDRLVFYNPTNGSTDSTLLWTYKVWNGRPAYSFTYSASGQGYMANSSSIVAFSPLSWAGVHNGYSSSGSSLIGGLNAPWQVVNFNDVLYVSDTKNNMIKKVTTSGAVSILVQNK